MCYKLVLLLKDRLAGSKEEYKITLGTDASNNNKNEKKLYNFHSKWKTQHKQHLLAKKALQMSYQYSVKRTELLYLLYDFHFLIKTKLLHCFLVIHFQLVTDIIDNAGGKKSLLQNHSRRQLC